MNGGERGLIVAAIIFGGIAVLCALISAVLTFFSPNVSSALGGVATVISMLLSIVAMLYTFFSGKGTLALLNTIEEQNKRLVDKINSELIKDAYDKEGIEDARTSKVTDKIST